MSRWMIGVTQLILVLVIAASVLLVGPKPALSDTVESNQPVVTTVTVVSTKPWTDTGIVVAGGDMLEIVASGLVSWDYTYVETGPDGTDNPSGTTGYVVMDPDVPAQSLIGNVAESESLDGKGFFVGSDFSGKIPIENTTSANGTLFLGFNDGAVFPDRSGYDAWGFGGDNHGSFTAVITVTREAPPPQSMAPRANIDLIWPNPAKVGDEIGFLGSGTDPEGSPLSFEWLSDKDDLLSTEASFVKEDLSEGKHEITLRVTNLDGLTSEARYLLEVGSPFFVRPLARITDVSPPTIFPMTTMSFTGEGIDPNSLGAMEWEYQWKVGDEVIATDSSFIHPGLPIGEYTISFKVWNEYVESDTVFQIVHVVSRPPDAWKPFWIAVAGAGAAVAALIAVIVTEKRRRSIH